MFRLCETAGVYRPRKGKVPPPAQIQASRKAVTLKRPLALVQNRLGLSGDFLKYQKSVTQIANLFNLQYNETAHPTKEETAMENSIVGVTRNEHGYQVTVKCDPSAIESMGGQSFTKMIFRSGENHQWFEFPSGERADPRMEVFLNKARAILDEESHSAR